MSDKDRINRVEQRVELLEKDNEIMQTDINATLKIMRSDIGSTLNAMRTENAKRDTEAAKRDTEAARRDEEAAKRETRIILTIVGLFVAGLTIQSFILYS